MKKSVYLLILLLVGCLGLNAQTAQLVNLDASTHGTTILGPGIGLYLFDDGGNTGDYSHGYDYYCTIQSTCHDSVNQLVVMVEMFNIGVYDTLYIYDGPTPTSPLIVKFNNGMPPSQNAYFVSSSNTSRSLCVRFRSSVLHADDTLSHNGFRLQFDCKKPCERVDAFINTMYERLDSYNNVIDTQQLVTIPVSLDSIWDSVSGTLLRVDTLATTQCAYLCKGQCIRLLGYGQYGNSYGYYHGSDATSQFVWTFDNNDTVVGQSSTYCGFTNVACHYVTLDITDSYGCSNTTYSSIMVRVAQNPIKTIHDLQTICNNDSLLVDVGYEGDNGTLTLRHNTFVQSVTQTNSQRTFIPDGPQCITPCFYAPITISEFPSSRRVTSADDICSICINFEHSFMGDYSMAITCPTYDPSVSSTHGIAYLKYQSQNTIPEGHTVPSGTYGGGGKFTGYPYGGKYHAGFDGDCDTTDNPYGIGLDYCFSRNGAYTLFTGVPADTPNPVDAGLASGDQITNTVTFPPTMGLPSAGPYSITTTAPSDHDNRMGYYIPADDFSTLVGCPLNGTWNIQVCDYWAIDNGWVFNWTLDICNSSSDNCEYQVGIDSVTWTPVPDSNGNTHININHSLGSSSSAYISSPDTAGRFDIKVSVFDEFGCEWDTLTHITTVFTPSPNLGNDTNICGSSTITLNASDSHSNNPMNRYTYLWEPYGDTTGSITTSSDNTSGMYVVRVTNHVDNIICSSRDTIVVNIFPAPSLSFDPGVYPLEGCEPFTLNIKNTTQSGYKYRWDFGDGTISNTMHPTHTYGAGEYDLKYYVETPEGCRDSLIYNDLVKVVSSPKAEFSWEPAVPSVSNPTISLHNNTTSNSDTTIYRWEVQYDKNMPYSVQTLTEENPTWTWQPRDNSDLTGNYSVKLTALTEGRGLSGQLIQCADTLETKITIINDQLEFYNLVTPDGDGINDIFIIKNLVEGMAFPINQLEIFNKWGKKVYSVKNISKVSEFWDPLQTNSPSGTYYYQFSGKGVGGMVERNGVIEVLRK